MGYEVKIIDPNGASKTYTTITTNFVYLFTQNKIDFGIPQPSLNIEVRALDVGGNKSEALTGSAVNTVPANPTEPPTLVTGFTLVHVLMHAPPNVSDLEGFDLYHSNSIAGPYVLLAQTMGDSFSHEVIPGSTNYYKYKVRDVFGQISPDFSPVSNTTTLVEGESDVTPPDDWATDLVAATGIDDQTQEPYVDLDWNINTATDLDHYEIRYRIQGEALFVTVFKGQDTLDHRIKALQNERVYEFQIRAVDRSANASSWLPATPVGITTGAGNIKYDTAALGSLVIQGAGGSIRSGNYVEGPGPAQAGWKLSNQGLEINQGTIRAPALLIGVSGENLLVNSSFENGLTIATNWTAVGAGNTYTIESGGGLFRYQSHSQKMTTESLAEAGITQTISIANGRLREEIPANSWVTISYWVKQGTGLSRSAKVSLTDDTNSLNYIISAAVSTSTAWTRVVHSAFVTGPNPITSLTFKAWVENTNTSEVFYFDGAQLQLSAWATSYSPATLEIPDNYIQSAYISNLSADKLTSGSVSSAQVNIDATGYIQSINYSTGGSPAGYRLTADKLIFQNGGINIIGMNGVLTLDSNSLRAVYGGNTRFFVDENSVQLAGSIEVTNTEIKTSNFLSNASGWQIASDGTAEFNDITVRGDVQGNANSVIEGGTFRTGPTGNRIELTGSLTDAPYLKLFTNGGTLNAFKIDASGVYIGGGDAATAGVYFDTVNRRTLFQSTGGGYTFEIDSASHSSNGENMLTAGQASVEGGVGDYSAVNGTITTFAHGGAVSNVHGSLALQVTPTSGQSTTDARTLGGLGGIPIIGGNTYTVVTSVALASIIANRAANVGFLWYDQFGALISGPNLGTDFPLSSVNYTQISYSEAAPLGAAYVAINIRFKATLGIFGAGEQYRADRMGLMLGSSTNWVYPDDGVRFKVLRVFPAGDTSGSNDVFWLKTDGSAYFAKGIINMSSSGSLLKTGDAGRRVIIDRDGIRLYGDDGSANVDLSTEKGIASFKGVITGVSGATFTGGVKTDALQNVTSSGKTVLLDTQGLKFLSASAPIRRGILSGRNGTSATTHAIGKPNGTTTNDVIIIFFSVFAGTDAQTVTISPPAGFTIAGSAATQGSGSSGIKSAVYYKVAGSSEPENYVFTLSGSYQMSYTIISYENVNTSTPIDAVGSGGVTNGGITVETIDPLNSTSGWTRVAPGKHYTSCSTQSASADSDSLIRTVTAPGSVGGPAFEVQSTAGWDAGRYVAYRKNISTRDLSMVTYMRWWSRGREQRADRPTPPKGELRLISANGGYVICPQIQNASWNQSMIKMSDLTKVNNPDLTQIVALEIASGSQYCTEAPTVAEIISGEDGFAQFNTYSWTRFCKLESYTEPKIITASSITTTVDSTLLLASFGTADNAGFFTPPSQMAEEADVGYNLEVNSQIIGPVGGTGNRTAITTHNWTKATWHMVALRAAGATTNPILRFDPTDGWARWDNTPIVPTTVPGSGGNLYVRGNQLNWLKTGGAITSLGFDGSPLPGVQFTSLVDPNINALILHEPGYMRFGFPSGYKFWVDAAGDTTTIRDIYAQRNAYISGSITVTSATLSGALNAASAIVTGDISATNVTASNAMFAERYYGTGAGHGALAVGDVSTGQITHKITFNWDSSLNRIDIFIDGTYINSINRV
ncbi:MAG TPA: hypothetical protein VJ742_12325 [Nitrososphaera sp.]|nr:hypothetical protein [Nitrososphaera sp.]